LISPGQASASTQICMVNLESWKLHTTPSTSYKLFIESIKADSRFAEC
jgi:hypothetical protein